MKNRKKVRSFALTKFFFVWVAIFVVAVIFSQTMPNSISAVFLIVAAALPFIGLLYVFIGRSAVKTMFSCDTSRTEKKSDVNYVLEIVNSSPLPFPFIDAEFILPDEIKSSCDGVDCVISLLPFGKFSASKKIAFKYRGYYVFGIKSVYIYDLLRFFKVRISGENLTSVFVVPRRIDLGFGVEAGVSDAPSDRAESTGYDRSEQTDIKQYTPGDPMKTVHWKLSGKTQELIVKKFSSESGQNVCVYADICSRFPADEESGNQPDINEYCADAVVETASSYIAAHLARDKSVNTVFHDARANTEAKDRINRTCCESLSDFEDFFEYFGASPTAPDLPFSDLSETVFDGASASVFVLSYLSDKTVEALCESAGRSGRTEVLLCEPFSRMQSGAAERKLYEGYIATLSSYGITVRTVSAAELN